MTFSVTNNNDATVALKLLADTNRALEKTGERINSGLRINRAEDNASVYAIAQGMRSDIQSLVGIQDALSLGESTTNVALDAAELILDRLDALKTEAIKAQDPTANRTTIQESINAIVSEISGIVEAAQFNGYNLLNATDPNLAILSGINSVDAATFSTSQITIQAEDLTAATLNIDTLNVRDPFLTLEVGPGFAASVADNDFIDFGIDTDGDGTADTTITFEFVDDPDTDVLTAGDHIAVEYAPGDSQGTILANLMTAMRDEGFTVTYNALGALDITHRDGGVSLSGATGFAVGTDLIPTVDPGGNPVSATQAIEASLTIVRQAVSRLASSAEELDQRQDFLELMENNLRSGLGSLVDANMAEESAELEALQTRQQLGLEALSIANAQPSAVLALFR